MPTYECPYWDDPFYAFRVRWQWVSHEWVSLWEKPTVLHDYGC